MAINREHVHAIVAETHRPVPGLLAYAGGRPCAVVSRVSKQGFPSFCMTAQQRTQSCSSICIRRWALTSCACTIDKQGVSFQHRCVAARTANAAGCGSQPHACACNMARA